MTKDKYYNEANAEDATVFVARHTTAVEIPGNRRLMTFTGVADIEFKGITSKDWTSQRVHLALLIPEAYVPTRNLELESWAPFVTINAIFNKDTAINAGWAVDNFGMDVPADRIAPGVIEFFADIAVRDSDGVLCRIGFNVTVSGKIVPAPPPAKL